MKFLTIHIIFILFATNIFAQNFSINFHGNADPTVDKIRILVDDPSNGFPGPPADVGEFDFTIEFWMKAYTDSNSAPAIIPGNNENWKNGNVIFDRDRFSSGRKYGISITGGKISFGVTNSANISKTICGTSNVLTGSWHHIAVQRSISGQMEIFVNGILEASETGPSGDISYPDDATLCVQCSFDNFLIVGGKKYNNSFSFLSYKGLLDELHISSVKRYSTDFTVPDQTFIPDCYTLLLFHFDEGSGNLTNDIAGIAGGPCNGSLTIGGDPVGPEWSTDFALPVELLTFSADVRVRNIKLWWTTGTEINNSGFDIERSLAGSDQWIKLQFINGKGNSNYPVNYFYEDKFLSSGIYSYRLKQIDYNGNYQYFNLPQNVEINSPEKFKLYQNFPNPFNPITKILYDIPEEGLVMIKVYDIAGRVVRDLVEENKVAGFYETKFEAENLPSGIYFLVLNFKNSGSSFSKSIKLTLLK